MAKPSTKFSAGESETQERAVAGHMLPWGGKEQGQQQQWGGSSGKHREGWKIWGGKADGLEGAFAGWEWFCTSLRLPWMPWVAVGISIPRCQPQCGVSG